MTALRHLHKKAEIDARGVLVTERRKFLRFQTAWNALCTIIRDNCQATAHVKNISKEGALIVLAKALSEGDTIDLSVDVPGDNIPIVASCEVAWQRASEKGKTYDTGVRFIRIDGADKGKLLERVYLEWLKILDKR